MGFLPNVFNRQQPQQSQQFQQQPQGQQQPQHPNQPQGGQGGQQQYNPNQNNNGSGGPAGSQHSPQNSQYNPGGNPSNPMDPFMQLMTPSPDVVKQRQTQQQQQEASLFGDSFAPDKVQGAVGGMDFAGGLDQQKVTAALGGDAGAFTEIMNSVARNAVAVAMQASATQVEHGVKIGTERFGSSLDSRFRDFQLRGQNSNHQALQHPAGKAMLKSLEKQIASANPNMPTSEITAQAEKFLLTFADQLTSGQKQEQEDQNKPKTTDWELFGDLANT